MADVTQQEIADRLNISRTTVSRSFTNDPQVNPQTRAQVFQLAAELNYVYSSPRNIRQRLNGKKPLRIAVLVGIPLGKYEAAGIARQILAGISDRAANDQVEIEVHYIDPATFNPPVRARRIVKGVNISSWAGILLLYPFAHEAVRNLQSRLPVLSILDNYDELDLDCVQADQHHGICTLVQHLISQGHRRIGFLSWQYRVPTSWVERRLGAYLEVMFTAGLPIDHENVINVKGGRTVDYDRIPEEAARRVREGGVTAWVCAADHQAYRLVTGLRAHGVRVPEDCSVTGFDGVQPPPGLPQVTTIAISLHDVGISAMHELQRNIEVSSPLHRHVLVGGRFLQGETTGPAPQGA